MNMHVLGVNPILLAGFPPVPDDRWNDNIKVSIVEKILSNKSPAINRVSVGSYYGISQSEIREWIEYYQLTGRLCTDEMFRLARIEKGFLHEPWSLLSCELVNKIIPDIDNIAGDARLSPTKKRLFGLLITRHNTVVTNIMMYSYLYNRKHIAIKKPRGKIIDAFVRQLRNNLVEHFPDSRITIKTVWGRGYLLTTE